MHPQHAIEPTRQAADYSGRDANGIAALRSLVADMAVAFPERLSAAIRGNLSGEFADLVRQAEAAGWRQVEAEPEIRQLPVSSKTHWARSSIEFGNLTSHSGLAARGIDRHQREIRQRNLRPDYSRCRPDPGGVYFAVLTQGQPEGSNVNEKVTP